MGHQSPSAGALGLQTRQYSKRLGQAQRWGRAENIRRS